MPTSSIIYYVALIGFIKFIAAVMSMSISIFTISIVNVIFSVFAYAIILSWLLGTAWLVCLLLLESIGDKLPFIVPSLAVLFIFWFDFLLVLYT